MQALITSLEKHEALYPVEKTGGPELKPKLP